MPRALGVGSGPSDPLLGYSWHRLALQAEIGQNRSVFPKRTKQPETFGLNDLTEPAGFVARRSRELAAEDVQEDACRSTRTVSQFALASATPSAKSEVGLCLAGSPLRAVLPPYRHQPSGTVRCATTF